MRTFIPIFLLIVISVIICELSQENILKDFENQDPTQLFIAYHSFYKRKYEIQSDLGMTKFKVFVENLDYIKNINSKNLTFKLGMTPFVDLTKEEFIKKHLVDPKYMKRDITSFLHNIKGEKLNHSQIARKESLDWKSLFLEPRDQGQCGSCWAFATAGSVESNWWKNNKENEKLYLSTQQLVDCNKENNGCNGGWYNSAFEYIQNEGLIRDDLYPYNAEENECQVPADGPRLTIDKYDFCEDCRFDDWYNLLSNGPIAVAVDATQFQFYKEGIINLQDCGDLNHAIIAVGWDNDKEVITIRNSWSTNWGEEGYMRVYYQQDSQTCSITKYGFLPFSTTKRLINSSQEKKCMTLERNIQYPIKLNQSEKKEMTFRGKGTGFVVKTLDMNSKQINKIKIAGSNNIITKVYNEDKCLCKWKYRIDPKNFYNYKLIFNNENVSLFINDIEFVCSKMKNNYENYLLLDLKVNKDSEICDLNIM